MGIVYKARDRETGEVLALKILKPEIAADLQIIERFKNELRLAHRITHHNVARLYEFHRSGDTVYLSMEYVEGESLCALLHRTGKLDVACGLGIARQLATGVAEAHRQSIAHRDLKPENIMLTAAGEVKVLDFGISRFYAANATATTGFIGTPAYMAPEQAEGSLTDHRTDIYALGLILYEMFTGTRAFTGDTPVSLALKQVRESPPPPRTLAPLLPVHVEHAILKCLEKDPADRFQSVEDLLHALEGGATGPAARLSRPRNAAPVICAGRRRDGVGARPRGWSRLVSKTRKKSEARSRYTFDRGPALCGHECREEPGVSLGRHSRRNSAVNSPKSQACE